MRDDEQEGPGQEEQKGQGQEDNNALVILKNEILTIFYRNIRERFSSILDSIWKFFKSLLVSTSTVGMTVMGFIIYAYASLVGFLYEKKRFEINEVDIDLANYLTLEDLPFLAVKNVYSFLVFIVGPPLFCIVLAIATILIFLILDVFYRFAQIVFHFAAKRSFQPDKYEYSNFRERITASLDDTSKIKHSVFFLPLMIFTIFKNICILIFLELVPGIFSFQAREVTYSNFRDRIPENIYDSSKINHSVFFLPLMIITILKNICILIFRKLVPGIFSFQAREVTYSKYEDKIPEIFDNSSKFNYSVYYLPYIILSILKNIYILIFRELIPWVLDQCKSKSIRLGELLVDAGVKGINSVLLGVSFILFVVALFSPLIIIHKHESIEGTLQSVEGAVERTIQFAGRRVERTIQFVQFVGGAVKGTPQSVGGVLQKLLSKGELISEDKPNSEDKSSDEGKSNTEDKSNSEGKLRIFPPPPKDGQLVIARGEEKKCFACVRHISSTANYMMFSIPKKMGKDTEICKKPDRQSNNRKLLVIPISNLSSFQIGNTEICNTETELASMRDEIDEVKSAIAGDVKAGALRDREMTKLKAAVKKNTEADGNRDNAIAALWASVHTAWEDVEDNTKDGSKRDGEITKLKAAVKEIVPVDGGLTKALKKLPAGVKKNTEAGGKAVDAIKALQMAVDKNTEAGGNRDNAIAALWASVQTTWEDVEDNTKDGIRRDVGIKANKESVDMTREAVKSNRLALQRSIEAGGRRDGEIKAIKESAKATREKLLKSIEAAVAIDGEVDAIRESVKKNTEAGGRRDGEIKVLQAKVEANEAGVKKNTETGDRRDGELIAIKESVEANAKDGVRRDGEIKVLQTKVEANEAGVKKNTETGDRRDGELIAIKESVEANAKDGIRRDGEIKTIKESKEVSTKAADDAKKALDKSTEAANESKKALEESTNKALKESANALGKSKQALQKSAETLKETRKVIDDSKKVLGNLLARHPAIPVTRFETLEKIGSKTISEIRYLLAGFDPPKHDLNLHHQRWLGDFYKAIIACAKQPPRASIRLAGFASAEEFTKPATYQSGNLCKSDPKASNVKNCLLANHRVASVAAFIEQIHESKGISSGKVYGDIVNRFVGDIVAYCTENGPEVKFGNSELNQIIRIKPWCRFKDMEKARIRIPDPENQPHYLNRSVHIIFENLGRCAEAGFSKIKQ